MALRRALTKRLINGYRTSTLELSPLSPPSLVPPNATKTNFLREFMTSTESGEKGFFRRFLHRRSMNQLPEFLSLPVGDKLREKLRGINITGENQNQSQNQNRLRFDGLVAPPVPDSAAADPVFGVTVEDARKLLRAARVEKLRAKLRERPESWISYSEFVKICVQECENENQGFEFAQMLDQSGNVIVYGNVVFLRPDQLAKSLDNYMSHSIAMPNDTRRNQLEQMEMQKALIDKKAKAQVNGELYCGLGFLVVQTLGFMRLTFWELSWDVMEPICFFVTSLHFALAYGFFLRTSTEPSFEGYFQRRFKAKQKKLMKIHNFDTEKYNHLCKIFYPNGLPNHEPGAFPQALLKRTF